MIVLPVLFAATLIDLCRVDVATPAAIAAKSTLVFTLFRLVSGGGFATQERPSDSVSTVIEAALFFLLPHCRIRLTSNITLLLARIFGMRDLHVAVCVQFVECLCGGQQPSRCLSKGSLTTGCGDKLV